MEENQQYYYIYAGVLANNTTWMLVTGYKHRDRSLSSSHMSQKNKVWGILARAAIAPIAWLVYGFIDGR